MDTSRKPNAIKRWSKILPIVTKTKLQYRTIGQINYKMGVWRSW